MHRSRSRSSRSRPVLRTGVVAAAATCVLAAGMVPANAAVPPPTSDEAIAAVVDGMSLRQLIGQMTWTQVYGNTGDHAGHTYGNPVQSNPARYGVDTPAEVIEEYDLGGVLYFAWSNPVVVNDPAGTAELSNDLQAASVGDEGSGIPLAVTIDQEGGIVARMASPVTVFPGNMALGATYDPMLAYAQGSVLGRELASVGVNVDFAPVVDVNTNPANPVIGVRSMGENPEAVAALGVGQLTGLQDNGVGAAAKHFPGHGDTVNDSHYGLPVVDYDRATLDRHLLPFKAAIEAGVDMVMTAHIIVEAIDDEMPGTLSHDVLTGLLREEMGFDGLITTDALDMAALKQLPGNPLTDGEIAVLAIQAGSDILLMSPDVPATFEAITEAVENDELTRERLEESVTRILEWKVDRGVWTPDPYVDVDAVDAVVGNAEHLAVADEIADRSLTLLRNEDNVLPLSTDDSVFVTGWGATGVPNLTAALAARGADATAHPAAAPTDADIAAAVAAAQGHDAILVMTNVSGLTAADAAAQRAYLAALVATDIPVIHVPVRNPYDVNWAMADAQLATYSYQAPSLNSLADAVLGTVNPSGRLPVNIPGAVAGEVMYPLGYGISYGTAVTPAAPTFTDQPGTANDSFTIPATEGVEYVVGEGDDAEVREAGTYPGEGAVAIAAVPLEGYYLAWDAEALWAHEFDAAGEEPTTPDPDPTTPGPEPTTPGPEPTTPGGDVYYENCDAARAAGAAPVHRGEPGYGTHLDRDRDGVGCEDSSGGGGPTAPGGDGPSRPPRGNLPSTGAEATGLVAGALLLLALGAGTVLAVRRRQTR
ncbi:glycoside hydrolase family 3 N-terminal domain-containing protein [Georgenia faecalis]|uniref:beta-N-acetylhexosaminidase n=1 Tax=Georgenia faecalis TaxID=2483799 RepID=A0ABV9DBA2_9MICO|nr:glycoside hydrolase family 3 N-terminal domain-containing protein [Georgenia faecalis]